MRSRVFLLIVVGGLIVASCGGGESAETATQAAPFHPIPADAVVVWGTATCDFSEDGVNPEGGAGFLVVCELDMSDARVSGTETQDRFRFVVGRVGAGTAWLAEEAAIANADGTWRGSVQAAEDDEAIPSGEARYVGDGAYEGLEFHYYFFHADLDDKAQLRGWISSGG